MAGVLNNTKKKTREICTKDTAIITLNVKGCYCSFLGAFSSSVFLFFLLRIIAFSLIYVSQVFCVHGVQQVPARSGEFFCDFFRLLPLGRALQVFFFLLRRTRLVRNPVDLVAALHPKPYLNPV